MGLIDEISTKRIHIEEKIRGNFLSICIGYGVIDLSHLVVLIIFETIIKCPNDSIRICIMPFVASVGFGFLEGKYSLENSSIGISVISEIITYQQPYRDFILTELVSPLPCMVHFSKLQSCVSGGC